MCNIFKDKRYLLILVAITQLCKELQLCKFFRDARGVVLITPGARNMPEIALSLTVFEINDIFHFP